MIIIYLLIIFLCIILCIILALIICKKTITGGTPVNHTNWYHSSDLTVLPNITVDKLHGYVLPHAGTRFTGPIISHTLRFKPIIKYKKAIIFYYPASKYEDIEIEDSSGKNYYYHEYYVPWQSCLYLLGRDIEYIPFNARLNKIPPIEFSPEVLIIVSSDFSHFYPFHTGFQLENKAAHALMHKFLQLPCAKIIDDYRTYEILFDYIPENYYLKWLGHDRSDTNGVGYMSFLLLSRVERKFDGLFVTVYDEQMDAHECLGSWNTNINEEDFIKHTLKSATETSRLTQGEKIGIPIKFITITYLHKELDKSISFIRGWHSIYAYGAFYLSDVLLEHSYPNGNWIKHSDTEWRQTDKTFSLSDTFNSLKKKSNQFNALCNLQLYYSEIKTITY
uniref:Uncharacterized protein n=1 Tax=viral metagenome TaxID=1070528 RepID=A0A6C0I1D0_9ZZZZ